MSQEQVATRLEFLHTAKRFYARSQGSFPFTLARVICFVLRAGA
jgi:hypothetical protein